MSDARPLNEIERDVRTYLADQARHGDVCIDADRIGRELSVGADRAATAVRMVADQATTLAVEPLAPRTDANTWQVTIVGGPTPFGRECTGCGVLLPEAAGTCPHCGRRSNNEQ